MSRIRGIVSRVAGKFAWVTGCGLSAEQKLAAKGLAAVLAGIALVVVWPPAVLVGLSVAALGVAWQGACGAARAYLDYQQEERKEAQRQVERALRSQQAAASVFSAVPKPLPAEPSAADTANLKGFLKMIESDIERMRAEASQRGGR